MVYDPIPFVKLVQKILTNNPCANMEAPNGRLLATFGGSFAFTPKLFCAPQILYFVVLRTIYFKHMIKTKSFPPENVFCPPNLKTWLRAWFWQNCLQLGYFVLKAIRPRDGS